MKCPHCKFENPEWIELISGRFACGECIVFKVISTKTLCKEMDIDYEKEKDMVKNESEPRNEDLHKWALELAAQVWCDPRVQDRVMDPEMAKVIANTIRKAVVTANDALVNSLHTARQEMEKDLEQIKTVGAQTYHVILSFLQGDLSYDNVAQAKKVLREAINSSTCSTCGCDCPGCGCASGCCTKCGCCKG